MSLFIFLLNKIFNSEEDVKTEINLLFSSEDLGRLLLELFSDVSLEPLQKYKVDYKFYFTAEL